MQTAQGFLPGLFLYVLNVYLSIELELGFSIIIQSRRTKLYRHK